MSFILKGHRKCCREAVCGALRQLSRTPPVCSVDSRSSSSLLELFSPTHRRHFGGSSLRQPSVLTPPRLPLRVPEDISSSLSGDRNRARTDGRTGAVFEATVLWADKSGGGHPGLAAPESRLQKDGIQHFQVKKISLKMSFSGRGAGCPIMGSVTLHVVRALETRSELW